MTRLYRGIRYDLWVVFALVCGMLLHAPAMSAHGAGADAIHLASAPHADHSGTGPAGGAQDDQCCAICTPAGCGLGPLPETAFPALSEQVAPIRWAVGTAIASAASDHHWPSPRAPPVPG